MTRPNFFIIGAPKCGTTTLLNWLRQHPNVLMPQTIEPHFFNTDHARPGGITRGEYEQLFAPAGDQHLAVGEKSVWYLASRDAVANILDYNSEARFIVCLRNPITMAYALHHQKLWGGSEQIASFANAWKAQDERAATTGGSGLASQLLYGPACALGSHVERLASKVPSDRIHMVFLDDMNYDPQAVYGDVLSFLGVAPFESDFARVNESKIRRSPLIGTVVRSIGRTKRALGLNKSVGILSRMESWNRVAKKWQPDPKMTDVLKNYYRDDIALLGRLTNRDLSHWLDWPNEA
jgi:hypothetical protein